MTETKPRIRPEDVYPLRQRCYRCRSFFEFLIPLGRFCSYECAGLPEPSQDPATWPREHHSPFGGMKNYYMSQEEAEDQARKQKGANNAYLCGFCYHWHVGTLRENRVSRRNAFDPENT